VTGRRLDELLDIFPEAGTLFDRIVAENGAVLAGPRGVEPRLLAPSPAPAFSRALRARGVEPLVEGRVVVATTRPHDRVAADVIRQMSLDLDVVFNRESVMILPAGVDKGTGVVAALAELGISPRAAIGIGDAENDAPLLAACALGVAVANALPSLRHVADAVTGAPEGAGVAQLVTALVRDDLRSL
jgi:hydroxymethylpyrimidine pyrophosphatase-like HAD family hydrolase